MSDMMICYLIGFVLGTIFGFFCMAMHATDILKRMGLWMLVKAFIRGARGKLEVSFEPLDQRSHDIIKSILNRSIKSGEFEKIEREDNESSK